MSMSFSKAAFTRQTLDVLCFAASAIVAAATVAGLIH
jgi:hypothetical protein